MASVPELSVVELNARLKNGEEVFLLDVREQYEHDFVNLEGTLIPLGELPARFGELDPSKEIIVYCHHGNRSRRAAEFLQAKGFQQVKNLSGGVEAWASEIDPSMPHY